MPGLTFAEQVKLVLGRKGMTIKQLAEEIEEATGMKMSRQNLTQRLGRDNFQEKDMRMIAEILSCPFKLSIIDEPESEELEELQNESVVVNEALIKQMEKAAKEQEEKAAKEQEEKAAKEQEEKAAKEQEEKAVKEQEEKAAKEQEEKAAKEQEEKAAKEQEEKADKEQEEKAAKEQEEKAAKGQEAEETEEVVVDQEIAVEVSVEPEVEDIYQGGELKSDINPYTGMEYATNSVRTHPSRLGYVQVYDRKTREWEEMTEWAFMGYQERQKVALGNSYQEPTYLD